jgi:hypothetical protein
MWESSQALGVLSALELISKVSKPRASKECNMSSDTDLL